MSEQARNLNNQEMFEAIHTELVNINENIEHLVEVTKVLVDHQTKMLTAVIEHQTEMLTTVIEHHKDMLLAAQGIILTEEE